MLLISKYLLTCIIPSLCHWKTHPIFLVVTQTNQLRTWVLYTRICTDIMAWLFSEYNVARNSHVLHWTFSIPRATSYSVNSQATIQDVNMFICICIVMGRWPEASKRFVSLSKSSRSNCGGDYDDITAVQPISKHLISVWISVDCLPVMITEPC